ncbi:MAG TPA: glutamate-cysteine ligase family protein [Kofleriaceae bacterium]|nr:glutamate-cysteine ligase family protein [Kofleriaceae bacterium]
MHLVDNRQSDPVESVEQLADYFQRGCKPRSQWRIGTEHEMIGVYARGPDIGRAPAYAGDRGIAAIFDSFAARGWKPVSEGDNVIALVCSGAQMTFEPGGQLEHALRPLNHADELTASMAKNVAQVAEPSARLGLAWLSAGFRPFGRLEDVPWMPKRRYEIMREYMPTRGALAHEMMKRTATVQVNLDFSDTDDAGSQFRCAMGISSFLTAIYANSPVVDGQLAGYQSYRSRVWLDTDPDRCGLLPFAFEDVDVFRAYTEWALDVPLFFVHRGDYRRAPGFTFRRFMREGFQGERATMDDWALHLSTLFPETRLKTYMELRGCDTGSFEMIAALGVLASGLLYDEEGRRQAIALTAGLSFAERVDLQREVPRGGLSTPVGRTGRTVGDIARDLLMIAAEGVARREPGELRYLDPVRQIVEEKRTQADQLIDLWRAKQGDLPALIRGMAYPGLNGELAVGAPPALAGC